MDKNSAAFDLADITAAEKLIVDNGGTPSVVVFGHRDIVRFNDLVLGSFYRLAQMGAASMADIQVGIRIKKYTSPFGDVDVVPSIFLAPISDLTEIFVLDDTTTLEDGNAISMVDLLPMSSFDLGLLQSAYRTLICEFTVLQLTCEGFQAKIKEVAAA